jgi:hypothetical protein
LNFVLSEHQIISEIKKQVHLSMIVLVKSFHKTKRVGLLPSILYDALWSSTIFCHYIYPSIDENIKSNTIFIMKHLLISRQKSNYKKAQSIKRLSFNTI